MNFSNMALRKIPMTMQDWETRLNRFLAATDREVLQDAGKVTAEIAKAHAESEFEKYRIVQDRLFESDFRSRRCRDEARRRGCCEKHTAQGQEAVTSRLLDWRHDLDVAIQHVLAASTPPRTHFQCHNTRRLGTPGDG